MKGNLALSIKIPNCICPLIQQPHPRNLSCSLASTRSKECIFKVNHYSIVCNTKISEITQLCMYLYDGISCIYTYIKEWEHSLYRYRKISKLYRHIKIVENVCVKKSHNIYSYLVVFAPRSSGRAHKKLQRWPPLVGVGWQRD